MSFNSEQKAAIEILVGLCMSCKDPPTLSQLLRDYSEMEGKQLDSSGFKTITDFLRASDRFHLFQRDGMLIVNAKLNYESAHIALLVGKQKSTNKRRGGGVPSRDGLFHVSQPRKRFTPAYGPRPTFAVRSLEPGTVTQQKSYQKPAYNRTVTKPRQNLPLLTITASNKNVFGGSVKRVVNTNSAPLSSKMTKVIKQQETAPVRPSQFSFPTKTINCNEKNGNYHAQKPLQKLLVVKQPPSVPFSEPQSALSDTRKSLPQLTVIKPSSFLEVPKIEIESPKVLTVRKVSPERPAIERVTQQFEDTSLYQRNDETKIPQNGLVSHRKSIPSSSSSKCSVQERLDQIKRSLSDSNETNVSPSKKIEHPQKEQEPLIPLEWWTTGNLSNVERLEEYCRLKGLPQPDYKYFKVRNENELKYQCRCTIEALTYSTYPDDFDTQEKSRNICAARAIANIKQQEELAQYPMFLGDAKEIATKIYDMLSASGVFLTEIPNLFRAKYHLSIPPTYILIMTQEYEDWFDMEQQLSTYKTIVYPRNRQNISSSIDSLNQENSTDSNVVPPKISLPWHEKHWNVLVTFPETTTSVWVNLLGEDYYYALLDLSQEIDKIETLERPSEILLNECYIAVVHDDKLRVKVVEECREQDNFLVHFIDMGEHQLLNRDQLFVCDVKFLELPAQAIPLSLAGLSLFENLPDIDYCLSDYNEKVYVAAVLTTEHEYRRNGKVTEVVLFDTSTKDDINMNDVLLEKIVKESIKPTELEGRCNTVYITSVKDTGIITGYLKDSGYIELIRKDIKRLVASNKTSLQQYQGITAEVDDTIYLVLNPTTGQYLRAKCISFHQNGPESDKIIVYLIDYGTELAISKDTEIYKLAPISKALALMPPQVVQMRLYDIEIKPNVVSLLRGMLKPELKTLVKVIKTDTEPLVKIFFRSGKNGNMTCINEAIKEQTALTPYYD